MSAAAFLALLCPVAVAQELTIVNAGFEAPVIPANSFSTTAAPPGWSTFGNLNFGARTVGVLNPATSQLYPAGAPVGSNVGVVFLMDDFGNQTFFAHQEAGLVQTLGDTLQLSTVYTLTVEVGNIADDPSPPNNIFLFTGFPGYRIELRAGNSILACDDNSLLPAEGTFQTATLRVAIGGSHTAENQPLSIHLVNLNAAPGLEVNFDDLRLRADPVWTDLGGAKAGVAGLPSLAGSGALASSTASQIDLANAAPNSTAVLLLGVNTLHLPFLGGTLVPDPIVSAAVPTDGFGNASLTLNLSPAITAGIPLVFQYWIVDAAATEGISASNGLQGVTS